MSHEAGEVEPAADHRLLDNAVRVLQSSGYRSLGQLHCQVVGDELIVSGVVCSYYLKQLAQTLILGASTTKKINNLLKVQESLKRKPL
jgi:hypothetical protein